MMEDILVSNKSGITTDRKVATNFVTARPSSQISASNPILDHLISEGGENFFCYIKGLGLAYETNIMVLSSRHNYYYDNNDLKGVSVLINLKRLNLMKHLDSFLHTVCNSLSPKSNLIGCFSNYKIQKRIDLSSNSCKKFNNNSLNIRTEIELDRELVSGLLELNRFRIIDMSEIKGLIYFRAENNRKMFN
jgi:hypothetical protein